MTYREVDLRDKKTDTFSVQRVGASIIPHFLVKIVDEDGVSSSVHLTLAGLKKILKVVEDTIKESEG